MTSIRRDSDTSRRFSFPRLGHAAIFAFVFFIAPRFLHPAEAPPPAYTVKIVDNIPAGDLGTHLPRINRHQATSEKAAAHKPQESRVKTEPSKNELALNDTDKNALKINAKPTEEPTDDADSNADPGGIAIDRRDARADGRACAGARAESRSYGRADVAPTPSPLRSRPNIRRRSRSRRRRRQIEIGPSRDRRWPRSRRRRASPSRWRN